MEADWVPWPTGTAGVAGVEEVVVEVVLEVAVFVAGEAGSVRSAGEVVDGTLVDGTLVVDDEPCSPEAVSVLTSAATVGGFATATFAGFETLGDAFFFVVVFVLLVVFVFVLAILVAIFTALFVALFVAVLKATALASMGSSTGTLP